MHSFPFFHLFSASFLTEISRAECSAALTHTSSRRRCEDMVREEEVGGGGGRLGLIFAAWPFFVSTPTWGQRSRVIVLIETAGFLLMDSARRRRRQRWGWRSAGRCEATDEAVPTRWSWEGGERWGGEGVTSFFTLCSIKTYFFLLFHPALLHEMLNTAKIFYHLHG